LQPLVIDGKEVDGATFADHLERWVLYGHIHIEEDDRNQRFVDQHMDRFMQEQLHSFEEHVATISPGAYHDYQATLVGLQRNTTSLVEGRALFWKFDLKESGQFAKIVLRMQNLMAQAKEQYHKDALKAFAAATAQRQTELEAGIASLGTGLPFAAFTERLEALVASAKAAVLHDCEHYAFSQSEGTPAQALQAVDKVKQDMLGKYHEAALSAFVDTSAQRQKTLEAGIASLGTGLPFAAFTERLEALVAPVKVAVLHDCEYYSISHIEGPAAQALQAIGRTQQHSLDLQKAHTLNFLEQRMEESLVATERRMQQLGTSGSYQDFDAALQALLDDSEKELKDEVSRLGIASAPATLKLQQSIAATLGKVTTASRERYQSRIDRHFDNVLKIVRDRTQYRLKVLGYKALYREERKMEEEYAAVMQDAEKAVDLEVGRLGVDSSPGFARADLMSKLNGMLKKQYSTAAETFQAHRSTAERLEIGAAIGSIFILLLVVAKVLRRCCCSGQSKEAVD